MLSARVPKGAARDSVVDASAPGLTDYGVMGAAPMPYLQQCVVRSKS